LHARESVRALVRRKTKLALGPSGGDGRRRRGGEVVELKDQRENHAIDIA